MMTQRGWACKWRAGERVAGPLKEPDMIDAANDRQERPATPMLSRCIERVRSQTRVAMIELAWCRRPIVQGTRLVCATCSSSCPRVAQGMHRARTYTSAERRGITGTHRVPCRFLLRNELTSNWTTSARSMQAQAMVLRLCSCVAAGCVPPPAPHEVRVVAPPVVRPRGMVIFSLCPPMF